MILSPRQNVILLVVSCVYLLNFLRNVFIIDLIPEFICDMKNCIPNQTQEMAFRLEKLIGFSIRKTRKTTQKNSPSINQPPSEEM